MGTPHARRRTQLLVTPKKWGNGYATAADRVVTYVFAELGLHRVTASVFDTNEASRQVIETLGFTDEGIARNAAYVDEEWRDVVRYGLLEGE